MTPGRWNYIKKLTPPKPRYAHVSCRAHMIPPFDGSHGPMMPFVSHGVPYRAGKNALKRANRAESIRLRKIARRQR